MEKRKTEKSRTDGRDETYGSRTAKKGSFTEKEKRKSTRPAGRPKKDDNEKSHYKDGGKPIRKSRPVWNDRDTEGSRHERYERHDGNERYDRSDKHDRSERTERYDRHDKHDRHESRDKHVRGERYDRNERYDRGDKHDRYERAEKHDRHDKHDGHEVRERAKRDDRYKRHDKPYRPERPKKNDRRDRPKRSESSAQNDTVRLNKFIANSGICSRREADDYIKTGLVTVNGEIVTELGTKVKPDDDIRFNGERLRGEKKVYLLMNKPKDYVTTMSDPHTKKCVIDLISTDKCKERVVPVGRLDKSTTGVLLFTNDGDLAARLTHPSYKVKKIYHVFLDKNLKKTDFDAIINGITLEDGEIHADALSYVDDDMSQVGIEIHSGRNRIVRRMFEHLGYRVDKLDRVYFAGLTKKNLRRGAWRFLTEQEITILKMGNFN